MPNLDKMDELKDLLWKFGVWDDLTHEQHLVIQDLINRQVRLQMLELIGEDEETSIRELSRNVSFEDAMSLGEEALTRNSFRANLRAKLTPEEP